MKYLTELIYCNFTWKTNINLGATEWTTSSFFPERFYVFSTITWKQIARDMISGQASPTTTGFLLGTFQIITLTVPLDTKKLVFYPNNSF